VRAVAQGALPGKELSALGGIIGGVIDIPNGLKMVAEMNRFIDPPRVGGTGPSQRKAT